MRCEPEKRVYKVSYPSKGSMLARIVGIVMVATGMLLIVFCVPLWAWMALIGTALIFIGVLLLQKGGVKETANTGKGTRFLKKAVQRLLAGEPA